MDQVNQRRLNWQCPNCRAMYQGRCECDCGTRRPMEKMEYVARPVGKKKYSSFGSDAWTSK